MNITDKLKKKLKKTKNSFKETNNESPKKARQSDSSSDGPDELVPVFLPGELDPDDEDEPGSYERAAEAFEWMIHPIPVNTFMSQHWEEKPLHIKRKEDQSYYKSLFSSKALDKIIREQRVLYGKNLDVTTFEVIARHFCNAQAVVNKVFFYCACEKILWLENPTMLLLFRPAVRYF